MEGASAENGAGISLGHLRLDVGERIIRTINRSVVYRTFLYAPSPISSRCHLAHRQNKYLGFPNERHVSGCDTVAVNTKNT
jgi:hypothetical protein